MRGKLSGNAMRQKQRQRDLSIRFGAFKVPGREFVLHVVTLICGPGFGLSLDKCQHSQV